MAATTMLPTIPDYVKSLAWHKAYPNLLRCSVDSTHGGTYPPLTSQKGIDRNQPYQYVNYQANDYALGSVTGPWWASSCMQYLSAWWPYSRADRMEKGRPGAYSLLYPHYVFNGMAVFDKGDIFFSKEPNKPLSDHVGGAGGPWYREFNEYGRAGSLQDRNTAILLYSPRPGTHVDRLVPEKITRASASMALYRHGTALEGIYRNNQPITSLPADFKAGDWWFVEDGDVYAGVLPLKVTDLGGGGKITLESRNRQLVLYADNYLGKSIAEISDDDWVKAQNGFVIELGDRKEYGSFENFRKTMLSAKLPLDTGKGFLRHVKYERPGKQLEVEWHSYNENYPVRSINGKPDTFVRDLESPEFAVNSTGKLNTENAALTGAPGKSYWLLSSPQTNAYVAYQPNLEQELPVELSTPFGIVSAERFPFGKIVLQKSGDTLELRVDASYPPFLNPWATIAHDKQGRGILPSDIYLQTSETNLKGVICGRELPLHPVTVDGKKMYRLRPYDIDPANSKVVDLGEYGQYYRLRPMNGDE
ncbi:MAG: hypothetical protein WCP55_12340, partial [Lentisphaerota bacterium]